MRICDLPKGALWAGLVLGCTFLMILLVWAYWCLDCAIWDYRQKRRYKKELENFKKRNHDYYSKNKLPYKK